MTDSGFRFLPHPTHEEEVRRVLQGLAEGMLPPDLESATVDIKEEAGRRDNGKVTPGLPQNEKAAQQLAEACACFANTEGGGALVVGVDDKTGEVIGADTNSEWLQGRIYELTERRLHVTIQVVELRREQILVINIPQAVEPIPYRGKCQHRLGKKCVPVSITELMKGLFAGAGADPSYQPSSAQISHISEGTWSLLHELFSKENSGPSLSNRDLLARLGLLSSTGDFLNHAGEILLKTREQAAIDYTYRAVPGGPSQIRINAPGFSLLQEQHNVEAEAFRRTRVSEVLMGFQVVKVRVIPERSIREVILNGICHRDWHDPTPTFIEHIGDELRVTSPGGFVRRVAPDNIITHASEPRYRSLMEAVRKLGLVEQEGTGVDRMYADLIRIGGRLPLIELTDRPSVRVILHGGTPDHDRYRFFEELPGHASDDVDLALALWRASNPTTPFLTAESCRTLLQRSLEDTTVALERIARYYHRDNGPVFARMDTPHLTPPAWVLSHTARSALKVPSLSDPEVPALAWVRERRRISTSEICELVDVTYPVALRHVKVLAKSEGLSPSTPSGRGRGVYYFYPDQPEPGHVKGT